MKSVLLLAAGYFALAAETTLRAEWCPQAPFAGLVWALVPIVAITLPSHWGLLVAACLGLGVDGIGAHCPGVGVCLASIAAAILQRSFREESLNSLGKRFSLCLAGSIVLSMALCAVQLLQQSRPIVPGTLMTQLLVTSAAGSLLAAVVGAVLRRAAHRLSHN